ncbi:MAG: RNA polymerase sigma factor [Armatimonadetes bacterium]|nr:RNA polymerase sigma factor [Armatimonadota bacterium]
MSLVSTALDRLPPDYQQILYLRYYEEWSVQKIAQFLSVPATTVKWRLHQGRLWMRKRLEAEKESAPDERRREQNQRAEADPVGAGRDGRYCGGSLPDRSLWGCGTHPSPPVQCHHYPSERALWPARLSLQHPAGRKHPAGDRRNGEVAVRLSGRGNCSFRRAGQHPTPYCRCPGAYPYQTGGCEKGGPSGARADGGPCEGRDHPGDRRAVGAPGPAGRDRRRNPGCRGKSCRSRIV